MMIPAGITRWASVARPGGVLNVISRLASSVESVEEHERPAVASQAATVKTDVSGLRKWHHRRYHGKPPVVDEETTHLNSIRVQRRIWALHGAASGINPAVAWPVKEEWADRMEQEALAYPDTLQEMIKKFKEEQKAKDDDIRERMEAIDAKMVHLEKWKKEIIDRKRKKEKELRATKEKHDRLIEEVKEYLGFRVDSKDPRFKEILEKKELEEKKRAKEAKKKEKQTKAIEKLRKMTADMVNKETSGKDDEVSDESPTKE